jgi:hypothetical protein
VQVYCSDYRCSHSKQLCADRWPDEVRLSDIEPKFVCQAVRPARRRREAGPGDSTGAIQEMTRHSRRVSHRRQIRCRHLRVVLSVNTSKVE